MSLKHDSLVLANNNFSMYLSTFSKICRLAFSLLLTILFIGCKQKSKEISITEEEYSQPSGQVIGLKKLSEYKKFELPLKNMVPVAGVIPYDLNSSLFTDYAFKKRFIFLPDGTAMTYKEAETFDFPDGSLIFKFFYYPKDFRQPEKDLILIETRVLNKENDEWTALTYTWNEDQTDAHLILSGDKKDINWINESGLNQSVSYSIPNLIQCKSCHDYKGRMAPIGPAARHLNKEYSYSKSGINQIEHFTSLGKLKGISNLSECPKIPDYNNAAPSIDQRARAYLDINCSHCHRAEGPAKNSALNLLYSENNPMAYGVMKTPVAAGKGSGGFKYDIYPGHHDQSILYYRMNSLDPGVTMPELGKNMIHKEGLALIRQWIDQMK